MNLETILNKNELELIENYSEGLNPFLNLNYLELIWNQNDLWTE